MAAGGVDEESWRRMGPVARKVYWAAVALLLVPMGIAVVYKVFY